jgi:predicted N-acyltransferase
LHFETCYYQAIDIAIERGLKTVEAGAQGEHKIQRGYEPVLTHSAHLIVDAGLRNAVARFLDQERHHIAQDREFIVAEHSPFKQE